MKKIFLVGLFLGLIILISGSCFPKADIQTKELETLYRDKILLIQDIHRYSVENLGLKPTKNCSRFNPDDEGYTYKFYAPPFKIPYSYDEYFEESESSDIFIYQASATAASEYGLSLLKEPIWEIIFAVFHEIWHDQVKLCSGIEESTGVVIGYAAGLKYTEEKFGRDSDIYWNLKEDFDRFQLRSCINNNTWEALNTFYEEYRAGKISEELALEKKKEILISAENAYLELLDAIWLFELNNASVGFDMTYTRYYPLTLQVYQATGEDTMKTIEIFKSILVRKCPKKDIEKIKLAEKKSAAYLSDIILQLQSEREKEKGGKNEESCFNKFGFAGHFIGNWFFVSFWFSANDSLF